MLMGHHRIDKDIFIENIKKIVGQYKMFLITDNRKNFIKGDVVKNEFLLGETEKATDDYIEYLSDIISKHSFISLIVRVFTDQKYKKIPIKELYGIIILEKNGKIIIENISAEGVFESSVTGGKIEDCIVFKDIEGNAICSWDLV